MLNEKVIKIRRKIESQKASIGSWLQLPSLSTTKLMIDAGYDWLCIDLEHGEIFEKDLFGMISLIQSNGIPCIVRVRSKTEHEYRKIAELGASGVIIPSIETTEEIEFAYLNLVWPPRGSRGIGFSPSNAYGKKFEEELNNKVNPLIVPMIETLQAIKNIDLITKSKYADAFLIGPYDLSASLNAIGKFESKIFADTINSIEKKMTENKKTLGMHIVEPDKKALDTKIKSGYNFIAYSMDTVFLRSKCTNPLSNRV